MAEIIPLEVPADATRGEKQMHALLKAALVPDEEFIVWFEPKPGGVRQRPDFLVWSQRVGLLIIEVKDWVIEQIAAMDAAQCTVLKGERREDHPSPTQQAYKYSLEYRDYLYRQPELRDLREGYGGKLLFPVGSCAAFTNIRRAEAEKIVSVLGESSCLFADDLEIDCADPDARAGFITRLKNAFSVKFSFDPLSTKQQNALRRCIYPEFHAPTGEPASSNFPPNGANSTMLPRPEMRKPVITSGPGRPESSRLRGWLFGLGAVFCLALASMYPRWQPTLPPSVEPSPVPPTSPSKPKVPKPKKPTPPISTRPALGHPDTDTPNPSPVPDPSVLMVVVQQVRFTVTSCTAGGGALTCGIAVRSVKGDREITIYVHDYVTPTSRVIDSAGREYVADGARLGSHASAGASAQNMLVEGIPLTAELHFPNADSKTGSIALLEVAGELGNQSFKARFRGVPIVSNTSSTRSDGHLAPGITSRAG